MYENDENLGKSQATHPRAFQRKTLVNNPNPVFGLPQETGEPVGEMALRKIEEICISSFKKQGTAQAKQGFRECDKLLTPVSPCSSFLWNRGCSSAFLAEHILKPFKSVSCSSKHVQLSICFPILPLDPSVLMFNSKFLPGLWHSPQPRRWRGAVLTGFALLPFLFKE